MYPKKNVETISDVSKNEGFCPDCGQGLFLLHVYYLGGFKIWEALCPECCESFSFSEEILPGNNLE